jgi:hypothetical protein
MRSTSADRLRSWLGLTGSRSRVWTCVVNGQIAAALSGESGETGFTRHISGPTIFVNPLMAIYFTVDLMALAARCLYLDRLEETLTVRQIEAQIEQFHSGVDRRIPRIFPH